VCGQLSLVPPLVPTHPTPQPQHPRQQQRRRHHHPDSPDGADFNGPDDTPGRR
jgi:hypothetical protein